jgi:hypothetical protein
MTSKPSVRYALIALLFTFVWMVFEHLMGWNTTRHEIGQYSRMLPMIVFWVLIFITVNQSRGMQSSYTFNQGLRDGMMMSLIFCAWFTVLIVLYQKFINPDFYITLKAFTIEQLKAKNATQAEIDENMKTMDMSFNGSAFSFFLLFVFSFGWGLILSVIAALVYRKK